MTKPRKVMGVVVGIASAAALGKVALAGDGQIVQEAPGKYLINPTVYQDLPRTQEQQDILRQELQVASDLICDFTEGRFRLGNVVVSTHPLDKRTADLWWFNHPGRANAPGSFGRPPLANQCTLIGDIRAPSAAPGGHINLYEPVDGEVIAHELGHLVFGLGDVRERAWRGPPLLPRRGHQREPAAVRAEHRAVPLSLGHERRQLQDGGRPE